MNRDKIMEMAREAGWTSMTVDRLPGTEDMLRLERLVTLVSAEKNKEITEMLDALKSAIPFIVTQSVGCHGYKCREPWCWSCYGEDDAQKAAEQGADALDKVQAIIAKMRNEV